MLREAQPLMRRLLPVRIRLEVEPGEAGRSWVFVDPTQVEQMLLNLVANARDAVVEKGQVTVSVLCLANEARLVVRDDGEGMSPEVLGRAIEPFFTTKPSGMGTGLGLSSVHTLVEAQGGRLELTSVPGRGTTVTLCWPLAQGPLRSVLQPQEETNRPRCHGVCRVLLVEDDPGIHEHTRKMLQRAGFQVTVASDVGQALSCPTPDVLVADVMLPDGLGTDVAIKLRHREPELPVAYLSGHVTAIDGVSDTLLAKPFSADALLAAVREALGQRQ